MKCPNCSFVFKEYEVLKISRYKSLVCPECQGRWNRRPDLWYYLVFIIPILPLPNFGYSQSSSFWLLCSIIIVSVLAIKIDAKTIRLLPATQRAGWKKILGDKIGL